MAGGDKTSRKEQVVIALLSCANVEDAAKVSGVSVTSIWRWMREDTDFQALYRQAKKDCIDQAISRLSASCSVAVTTLVEIAVNSELAPSARVSACRAILDNSTKGIEAEVLLQKVEELENALLQRRRA